MMTEDEAKKKWCPQAQVSAAADSGSCGDWWNRDASFSKGYGQHSCCIASECMAWRWVMEEYTRPGGDPLVTRKAKRRTGEGFCGLATNTQG